MYFSCPTFTFFTNSSISVTWEDTCSSKSCINVNETVKVRMSRWVFCFRCVALRLEWMTRCGAETSRPFFFTYSKRTKTTGFKRWFSLLPSERVSPRRREACVRVRGGAGRCGGVQGSVSQWGKGRKWVCYKCSLLLLQDHVVLVQRIPMWPKVNHNELPQGNNFTKE